MSFIQEPAYILTVLLLLVVFSEWLATRKFFKHLGAALIIIIAGAIVANFKIIPSSYNAPVLYSRIFEYAAPLGIFFLLLEVKLKDLKLAGLPMLVMFFIGAAATVGGVLISFSLLSPQHHGVHQAYAVAGMYTGTYIGGSINLNAVALNYGVNKDGNLFAAVNAVDNIVGTVWMMAILIIPAVLQRFIPRKRKVTAEFANLSDEEIRDKMFLPSGNIRITDIAILLALGFGSMFIASQLSKYVPAIPSIITLTTLALVMAQLPFVQQQKGAKLLGLLMIMLFLAVIGAYCDIHTLLQSGNMAGTLLIWVTAIVILHGVIIFIAGGLLKQDWDIIAIASNANIGGSASAPVCAISIGRPDLQLPGLLAGSIGNAIGAYVGILVAEILK
ncbi:MAG: DUF819 family protein [Terrimonas sp.]|nr:DUF819 family protein [Terrimonas sp.]